MSVVEKLRLVLASDLLSAELVVVPTGGASLEQIRACETLLCIAFSTEQRNLLTTWNGLNLDVVRFGGVPPVEQGIESLVDLSRTLADSMAQLHLVPIGSDPAGFVFFQTDDGRVCSLDHDGGNVELVASDFREFVCDVLFGESSHQRYGQEWLDALRLRSLA
jgi:hypothetical protein